MPPSVLEPRRPLRDREWIAHSALGARRWLSHERSREPADPVACLPQAPFSGLARPTVFVTSPVFVPENGVWRKQKRQPKNRPPKSPEVSAESTVTAAKDKDIQPSLMLAPDVAQVESKDVSTADDAAGSYGGGGNGNGLDETEEKKSGMTMFNLVFILKPRKHETKELSETLHNHILRKINKLFKYSQQKTDFVWKESKHILTLKDKNREEKTKMSTLWNKILDESSLAACMRDIYDAVSQNKIAALQLKTPEGTIAHSVQIPVPFYLTDLPSEEEAASTRGLWITTANYFVEEDSLNDPSFLDKNFGLLLMSDEKKIIAELQADADEATAAMVEFVRLSRPTMSFHQISQGSGLSPAQVRKYAQHFIFWRRAIALMVALILNFVFAYRNAIHRFNGVPIYNETETAFIGELL
ncbi:hypothetical protein NUW58_g10241 [Xylaria curta]|uniref:Uncharacterized protein n=1 Tax=Xylaria curta TaxID=42375 RepID=A0ACC1MPY5_9PEZI|nr:hypothetical protein NUW58_g10241 [Xylaria curta]